MTGSQRDAVRTHPLTAVQLLSCDEWTERFGKQSIAGLVVPAGCCRRLVRFRSRSRQCCCCPLRSDRSRGLAGGSSDDRTARSQDRDVNKSNRLSPSMPRAKSRNMEGPKVKWRRNESLLLDEGLAVRILIRRVPHNRVVAAGIDEPA